MLKLEALLKKFDYFLPPELIAQAPLKPRDSARVLVFNRKGGKTKYDIFANIGKYLPKNCILVFNQTKVIPARMILKKTTGGRVEILYISNDKKTIKVIANRKLNLGQKLNLDRKINFEIVGKKENFYFLRPNFAVSKIKTILQKHGQTPLPPYIKNSPLTEAQKRKEYQTIFAKHGLSVAAPTASLHFTKNLMQKLKRQGIEIKFLTLNVNLGTFAPLKEENLQTGKLHLETYEIDKKIAADINKAKQAGRPIVAVGTTVVRTLESAANNNKLTKLEGSTQLFIQPGYKFKIVDSVITNFHVPKSSLMMLVSALVGRKTLLNLYKKAIKKRFRFFSFGDGMLILQ